MIFPHLSLFRWITCHRYLRMGLKTRIRFGPNSPGNLAGTYLAVVFVISLIGNSTVLLFLFAWDRSLRTPTNMFLLSITHNRLGGHYRWHSVCDCIHLRPRVAFWICGLHGVSILKGKLPQAFMQIVWMEDDFRNLTTKVWANLDNPIKRYDFSKVSLSLCMSALSGDTLPISVMSWQYNYLMGTVHKFVQNFTFHENASSLFFYT